MSRRCHDDSTSPDDPQATSRNLLSDGFSATSEQRGGHVHGGLGECESSQVDFGRYQILRIEAMSDRGARIVTGGLQATIFISFAGLLALSIAKHAFPNNTRIKNVNNEDFIIAKAVASLIMFALLLTPTIMLLWRLRTSRRRGLAWSKRRQHAVRSMLVRAYVLLWLLFIVLAVNASMSVPGNIGLAALCSVPQEAVGAGFNIGWATLMLLLVIDGHNIMLADPHSDSDRMIGDQPISRHWKKVVFIWAPMTGISVWLAIHAMVEKFHGRAFDDGICSIRPDGSCHVTNPSFFGTTLWIVFTIVFSIMHGAYLILARRQLQRHLWQRFRAQHVLLQVQMRFNVVFFIFWVASGTALWFALYFSEKSCNNWAIASMGILPCLSILTGTTAIQVFLMHPIVPSDGPVQPTALLQQLAWTERQLKAKQACKDTVVPTFCVETAIKAFFWSAVIYDFDEGEHHRFSAVTAQVRSLVSEVTEALGLYNLTKHTVFYEKTYGTKIVVASSADTILVCARGSTEPINFIHDCNFSQTRYPPDSKHKRRSPRVHRGFLATWQANGIGDRVVAHINGLLNASPRRTSVRVITCGHSLGGAIASLAALDVSRQCGVVPMQLSCYTFGCPRMGNHAFAHVYSQAVPDTWHVINNQDIVSRKMKFFRYYKRHGQRVIINQRGDLVVSPSFLEFSLLQNPFGGSVEQHMNMSYHNALCSVVSAQLEAKQRHSDGIEGLLSLLQDLPVMRTALNEHARTRGVSLSQRIASLVSTGASQHSGRSCAALSREASGLHASGHCSVTMVASPRVREGDGEASAYPTSGKIEESKDRGNIAAVCHATTSADALRAELTQQPLERFSNASSDVADEMLTACSELNPSDDGVDGSTVPDNSA